MNNTARFQASTFANKPVILDSDTNEIVVFMTNPDKAETLAKQWNTLGMTYEPSNPFQVARLYTLAKRHDEAT
jgi:hypothetical protein